MWTRRNFDSTLGGSWDIWLTPILVCFRSESPEDRLAPFSPPVAAGPARHEDRAELIDGDLQLFIDYRIVVFAPLPHLGRGPRQAAGDDPRGVGGSRPETRLEHRTGGGKDEDLDDLGDPGSDLPRPLDIDIQQDVDPRRQPRL